MGRGDTRNPPKRRSGAADAYDVGLRLLGSRELSVQLLREHLRRRGFDDPGIQAAIDRLRREGAVDDGRAALALARAQIRRGHGRSRIVRELEARGLDTAVARKAADQALAATDEAALLERAIARRLRRPLQNRSDLQRLYRALIAQGFAHNEIFRALKRRSALVIKPNDE